MGFLDSLFGKKKQAERLKEVATREVKKNLETVKKNLKSQKMKFFKLRI